MQLQNARTRAAAIQRKINYKQMKRKYSKPYAQKKRIFTALKKYTQSRKPATFNAIRAREYGAKMYRKFRR